MKARTTLDGLELTGMTDEERNTPEETAPEASKPIDDGAAGSAAAEDAAESGTEG